MSTVTLDSAVLQNLIQTLDHLREMLEAASGGAAPPPPPRRSDSLKDPPAFAHERAPGRQEFLRREEDKWRQPVRLGATKE